MDHNQILNIVDDLFSEYRNEKSQLGDRYAEEPLQDVLGDLLTDIRHYCHRHQLDFEKAVELSEFNFEAENEL